MIEKMCENLLVRFTNSWWNGGNIYGKKTQMLTFPAGIDLYETMCRQKLDNWDGFKVVRQSKRKRKDSQVDEVKNAIPRSAAVAS